MFIREAYATETATPPAVPPAPGAGEAFAWNMGMVLILVVMFYVLLIMPQQRRIKEHATMLNALKKGDRVVVGGGLVGTLDKIGDGDEAVVDLGNGVKVSALRSALMVHDSKKSNKK